LVKKKERERFRVCKKTEFKVSIDFASACNIEKKKSAQPLGTETIPPQKRRREIR